ncbi:hypothetical protein Golomagni_02247 [Golovinomyces magnicellulatus]|nr:hypothetical protein Golomagni_02247 [Golovinomyces magnicellulatus]
MNNHVTEQDSILHGRVTYEFTATDSTKKLKEPSSGQTIKDNNSHPNRNERDTRTKTAMSKKNKKNSRKSKKKDLLSVTEENLTESTSTLQVEKIDQDSKENCKNAKAKNKIPELETTMNCPITPPYTKSPPATPSQNKTQGKPTTQEDDSSLNNRNLPSTVSPTSRDVECERLESSFMDIENGSNKHNIGRESACVSTTDTLAKTLENPESLKLAKSLSIDDPCCHNTLDGDVKNGPLEVAKVVHENPRQEFSLPTLTNWNVSTIEVINERTKLEPTAPISDYFNNNFDSTDELDAFKAETASIFQLDEENTFSTPVDIQSNTAVAKETESNAIDKPASLTKMQQAVRPHNEFIVPPVAAGINTMVNKKEYEKTNNLDLVRSLNNEENLSEPSSISVSSDQGFDTLSNTHTTEPDTPTRIGLEDEKIHAKKPQEKIKADSINIAQAKRDVSLNNSLPNVEAEGKSFRITTSFNSDAKFNPDERFSEGQVSDILMSKQILNEENEFKDETNHELPEMSDVLISSITEVKTENRMGVEPDAGISVPSTSEVTGFIQIDSLKKDCPHDTDETETLSENEQFLQEEKIFQIDPQDSSKTVSEISIAPSSISIPAMSFEEAVRKGIIEEIHTRDIKRNEVNNNNANFDPNINHPNRSLSHLMHGLPTQAYTCEMGLLKDLVKLGEQIGSKEISLAESSYNQSPVVSRNLTESTFEHSIIEPEYIKSSIIEEDMASYLKASNIDKVQREIYRKINQMPSNLNTPTFEANFDSESDLKSKKNADYIIRTRASEGKEAYTSEEDMDINIHNIFRPTVGEQALAPELVIISKETLNHLHKKTALMQAEILRLSTVLKNQKNASESKPKSKITPTQSTQQYSEVLENNEIAATQLPKLAKTKSSPRTKSLWGNLWPFGSRDTQKSTTISPQQVTRKGQPYPQASIGESTESVTPKEVKRYKVIGRVRAKDIPGEDCIC